MSADRTVIKTTVELDRAEWMAGRSRALEADITMGEYVERLLHLARTDAKVHRRVLDLDLNA